MNYPTPVWRPVRTEAPDWFVDRMVDYTERQKSFLVYNHGTAVFDDSPLGPDIVRCNALLLEVVTHAPHFSVMPMRDGNFLVSFRGTVYGLVDGVFAKQNQKQLMSDALEFGLLPSEALLQSNDEAINAGHHVIGLYARANLYMDAESQVVAGRFTSPVT